MRCLSFCYCKSNATGTNLDIGRVPTARNWAQLVCKDMWLSCRPMCVGWSEASLQNWRFHWTISPLRAWRKRYTEIFEHHLVIFVCFKKLICLFNVLKKFSTVHRRPGEAAVLSSTNWIKSLRTSRRRMTRNHRSGLSFAIRHSSCFADAAQ